MDHSFLTPRLFAGGDSFEGNEIQTPVIQMAENQRPLLEREEEEDSILEFIRNPDKYRAILVKNQGIALESLKMTLKLKCNTQERSLFRGQRRVFAFGVTVLVVLLTLFVIAIAYSFESLSLGCGALTFFLTTLTNIHDLMKPVSPNLAEILRNVVILVVCLPLFGVLALSERETSFLKELSQSLFTITIGFFVGIVIIKPLTKCLGNEE